jgi:hypothetical protein
MARQCPCGHDGTKPGEGADDTSARHHTHQHQISLREGQATRDKARGHHGRDPRRRRRRSRGHQGGNRPDLSDRQERCCKIYRLIPISAANSGGGHQNRARWRRGDAVTRAQARGRREVSEASARSV